MSRNTVIFPCAEGEAHLDGDKIKLELKTEETRVAMIFPMDPKKALSLAHQIEKAYHRHEEGRR